MMDQKRIEEVRAALEHSSNMPMKRSEVHPEILVSDHSVPERCIKCGQEYPCDAAKSVTDEEFIEFMEIDSQTK